MPDDKKFPPSGRLFANNRKSSPNAPDVKGDLEISREVLDHLIDCYENGQPIKMDIAGWKKAMKKGGTFYSLSASIPWMKNNSGQDQTKSVPERKRPVQDSILDGFDDPNDEIPF